MVQYLFLKMGAMSPKDHRGLKISNKLVNVYYTIVNKRCIYVVLVLIFFSTDPQQPNVASSFFAR